MSAHREFFEAQQLLNNIFNAGHIINDANVDYLISELREHAYNIVMYNFQEHNRLAVATPTQPTVIPPTQPTVIPPTPPTVIPPTPPTVRPTLIISPTVIPSPVRSHFRLYDMLGNDPVYARLPVRNNPLEKSKILAKKKLEEACPLSCAICFETPKYKDAVCTECNHYYCKTCWSNWMNAERSNKKCPTCRKDIPITTSFKARATKRRLIVEN
jgi:hypothetical protein